MTVKVAINGFGRIGRNVLRAIIESGRTDIQVVAINDLAPVDTNAHLLRFDSVHGRFPAEVVVEGDTLVIGQNRIKGDGGARDPAQLPTRSLASISRWNARASSPRRTRPPRISPPAPAVSSSRPCRRRPDITVVYGVNHQKLAAEHVVSPNASCTTNCLAPVAKVLNDAVGIQHGFMTTVHSYTNDQPSLDRCTRTFTAPAPRPCP